LLETMCFSAKSANIAQIFEGTQARHFIFLLPLIIAAWLLLL